MERSFLGRGLLLPPGTFPWSGTQFYHWGAFSVHEHFPKSDIKDLGWLISTISAYHCFLGTTSEYMSGWKNGHACLRHEAVLYVEGRCLCLSPTVKASTQGPLTLCLNYTFQDNFVTHIHGPKSLQMTGLRMTLEVFFFLIIQVNIV